MTINAATVAQIEAFVAGVQKMKNDYLAKTFKNTPPACTFSVEYGRKNARIVQTDHGSRSVFCFIDLSNGDILKAAGWNAPAKHARGNINTPTAGVEFVGPYGPAYLR